MSPFKPGTPCARGTCPEVVDGHYCDEHQREAGSRVTVVCGPPGAGKTTYVERQRQRGDAVVDFDHLYSALTLGALFRRDKRVANTVFEVREFLLDHIWTDGDLNGAWVTATAPRRKDRDRFHDRGANVLMIDIDQDECEERIRQDDRRSDQVEHHLSVMREWYRLYERHPKDTLISP